MKHYIFSALLTATAGTLSMTAQLSREEIISSPELMSGVYHAYEAVETAPTQAPKGYKPFYISHYGRHGSRYLLSDSYYDDMLSLFKKAEKENVLTPLGKDVYNRMKIAGEDYRGRTGELSELGNKQHYGIGRRMITNYPEVFAGNPEMSANSTTVMRCAHSMFSFIDGLKSVDPSLVVPRESSPRTMYYLNNHTKEADTYRSSKTGPWKHEYARFSADMTRDAAKRIPSTLFSDSLFIVRNLTPQSFVTDLYRIATDLPDVPAGEQVTMYDLFTPEEMFNLWQRANMSFYIVNGAYPISEGVRVDSAKELLKNIVETADSYITGNKNGATLRFGHDTCITPLVALMRLENCANAEADPYKVWEVFNDFAISPMGANLQLIFYKNKKNDILVKLLLNEKEIAVPDITPAEGPFYRWVDLRRHFEKMLSTPSRTFMSGK